MTTELSREDTVLVLDACNAYAEETLLFLSRRVPALDATVDETRGRLLILCARLRRSLAEPVSPPEPPPA